MKHKTRKLKVLTKPLFAFRGQVTTGDFSSSTDPTTTTVTITTSLTTGIGSRP